MMWRILGNWWWEAKESHHCLIREHVITRQVLAERGSRAMARCHRPVSRSPIDRIVGHILLSGREDVLIEMEEIGGIVLPFDRSQTWIVGSVTLLDALLAIVAEVVDVESGLGIRLQRLGGGATPS